MMRYILTIFVLAFLHTTIASAQTTGPIKQILYTKETALVYPKTHDFTFSLWTDPESTNPASMIWSEDQTIIMNGPKLVTYLGKATPLNISDFTQQLWVQVEFKHNAGGIKVVGTRDRYL